MSEGAIAAPERLDIQRHDVTAFDCGKPVLNEWLQNHAATSEGTTARIYAVCEASNKVIGYYCISAGSMDRRAMPKKYRRHGLLPNPVPVGIIG